MEAVRSNDQACTVLSVSATHFYTGATVRGELRPDIGEQTVVIEMSDGAGTMGVARQSQTGRSDTSRRGLAHNEGNLDSPQNLACSKAG
ncbi:MAG: hypothetical protein CBARDCOR_5533 [uncultured Caballeronia sp.]|nr:MAG: hypothetical protein CBARDCOR_5533 [uncultured Caballeronia sp.]